MTSPRPKRKKSNNSVLKGQLLIAMPTMTDRRFARSVIYICAHSREGAMGLIINQQAPSIDFKELLTRLDLLPPDDGEGLPSDVLDRQVHLGGPVETTRGFVLHTSDYHAADATLSIDRDTSLTASIDILKAMAAGCGPARALLALGYAGWSPGQIEREIQANGWLNVPADSELLFDGALDTKYDRALAKLGVDLSFFVSDAGHA